MIIFNQGIVLQGSNNFLIRLTVYVSLRIRFWRALYDLYCCYFSTEVMMKVKGRARGLSVTLIKAGGHLIDCNPGMSLATGCNFIYYWILFPQIRNILINKLTSAPPTDNTQAQIMMSALIEVSQEKKEFSSSSQVKRLEWCGHHHMHAHNHITRAISGSHARLFRPC